MNKTIGWILAALVIIGVIWAVSASKKSNDPTATGLIKIGAPLILSGDFAKYGERARRAIDLAVEKFNQEYPEVSVKTLELTPSKPSRPIRN